MISPELNLSLCPVQDPVCIFNPDGDLIIVTEQEHILTWIRMQIAKQSLHGYYIIFRGEKYEINHYGVIKNWPKGLFDYCSDFAVEIISASMKTKEKEEAEQTFEFWKRETTIRISKKVQSIIDEYIHESYEGEKYPEVHMSSKLEHDLEIDSLSMVELIMKVEEELKFPTGLELPDLPYDPDKDYTVAEFCKHTADFIHHCENEFA